MVYLGILLAEIAILFLLSRSITKTLSKFMSINFLSLIFLPGVVVHELSHLFMAVVLFVPVGNMEFVPKKSEGGLKLGSVEIGKTDPVRRSLIGFAPFLIGFALIVFIVYLFTFNIEFFKDKGVYVFLGTIIGISYLLFAISNTMFSSKKDMEGTIEILATLLIISVVLYILGVRPSISFEENAFTKNIFEAVRISTIFMSAPIAIDLVILGLIRVFRRN